MQVSEEYTVCLVRNAELSAYVESSDEEDFPPVPWSIPHQFRTAGNSLGARQPTSVKGSEKPSKNRSMLFQRDV